MALGALEAQAADSGNGGRPPTGEHARIAQVEADCEACRTALEESVTSIGRVLGRLAYQTDRLEGIVDRLAADVERGQADLRLHMRLIEENTKIVGVLADTVRRAHGMGKGG
jgi:hypothetical protein